MNEEQQVITFTIHNPAARNVQCFGRIWSNVPCPEPAVWGVLGEGEVEGHYEMLAYCEQHFSRLGKGEGGDAG